MCAFRRPVPKVVFYETFTDLHYRFGVYWRRLSNKFRKVIRCNFVLDTVMSPEVSQFILETAECPEVFHDS